MSEIASEIRQGLQAVADAIKAHADNVKLLTDAVETHAGVMAAVAAIEHSTDYGDQRNMAGVFFAEASVRYVDTLRKMDDKERQDIKDYVQGICGKNLPKGKAAK